MALDQEDSLDRFNQARLESEARTRAILDAAVDAILTIDEIFPISMAWDLSTACAPSKVRGRFRW